MNHSKILHSESEEKIRIGIKATKEKDNSKLPTKERKELEVVA